MSARSERSRLDGDVRELLGNDPELLALAERVASRRPCEVAGAAGAVLVGSIAAWAFMSATSRSSFSVRAWVRMALNCRAVRNIIRVRIETTTPAMNAQAIRNNIDAWIVRPYQYQNVTSGPMFLMMKTSR